jgi:hypothetical protein
MTECPSCGGEVRLDQDGNLVCGFTMDEMEFGCGWEEDGPLLELAPKP